MSDEYDNAAKELIKTIIEMQTDKVFFLTYLQENEMLENFTEWSASLEKRINIQTKDK